MVKNSPSSKDEIFLKLFEAAKKYLDHAHSPYSRVKVASAVLMSDGDIFGGCNVENASFGGTICAERVAITKAVSEGHKKIEAILVVTNQKNIWPPCGLCRQVISEFASKNLVVYACDLNKKSLKMKFSELFPSSFDAETAKSLIQGQ